ncbi:MAG: hypothetical protein KDE63_04160 [Novosphingobium sp.]|nr:hypothetical protein [Novosphingobium sp.]
MTASRLRSIGWAALVIMAVVGFAALTFRVNAVKSEVRLAERQIVSLQNQNAMLETEFQTRASQRQLANWNDVEFGYRAPDAQQFLEGERQLARFGTPRAPGAPEPIRVANAEVEEGDSTSSAAGALVAMVSPLTGKAIAAEVHDVAVGHSGSGRTAMSAISSQIAAGGLDPEKLGERARRIVLTSAQEATE